MSKNKLDDTQLVFFNQYRQLCLYSNYGNKILYTHVLLSSAGDKRYIELRINGQDIELYCSSSAPDASEYGVKPYKFNNNAGMFWLDPTGEASIVIGMGDIRDIVNNATVNRFPVPTDTSTSLIIECNQAYQLKIHYKNITVGSDNVPASTIEPCS